ncbi:hypothetical protein [Kribbella sp. CA-294648]|uniref:hypothetical protein n=1 Tax=Kribbella sp. CA-294648 TaxID=3239948 RepID=UPI003D919786
MRVLVRLRVADSVRELEMVPERVQEPVVVLETERVLEPVVVLETERVLEPVVVLETERVLEAVLEAVPDPTWPGG